MATEPGIKELVRLRDGYKCVQCGMTNEAHIARYGKSMDVHRRERGSRYTIDGCETVCKKCHAKRHDHDFGREPRPVDRVGLRLELSIDDRNRLLVAAARAGKSMATYLRHFVLETLDREVPKPDGAAQALGVNPHTLDERLASKRWPKPEKG